MVTNVSVPQTPPGLPTQGTTNTASSNGSTYSLNADNGDWSNSILPTSLCNVGAGTTVSFPSILYKESQSNSLAIHTYPNLDSARVENMGRNPAKLAIRGIFTNNIFPGLDEVWKPGTLFPTQFENLLQVLLNTSTDKTFVHPIYGQMTVQVESWTYELNPKGPRDGAIVEMVLVETIGAQAAFQTPPSTSPGSALNSSAIALDTAIANAPNGISPPGMSLSQLFGSITSTLQSALSFPQNTIAALNSNIFIPITNGISSITGAFVSAPATIAGSTNAIIQQTKNGVINSPLQAAVNLAFNNPQNKFGSTYDASTYQATQAVISLNYTPSQNTFQLIDKIMAAVIALQQHYINQNSSQAAFIIEALRKYLLQLQQTQSSLITQNKTTQSIKVFTYVPPVNMSWVQISKYLNNSVDELMGLNQGLINDFWIPAFTTVSYYQSS